MKTKSCRLAQDQKLRQLHCSMPPKAKAKGAVVQGPQYPVPPPPPTPAPLPIPSFKRGVCIAVGNQGVATIFDGALTFHPRKTAGGAVPPLPVVDRFITRGGGTMPLDDPSVTVKAVACSRSSTQYMLLHTTHGLLRWGALCDEDHPQPLQAVTDIPLDDPMVLSAALGSSHAVVAVVPTTSGGGSSVLGFGDTTEGQLSESAAVRSKVEDFVPRPILLRCLEGEGICQLWAAESMTFALGRRGLFAIGRLGVHASWPEPVLVVPTLHSETMPLNAPEEALSVAIGQDKVYILMSNREILLLEESAPRGSTTPRNSEAMWSVSNVTSHLFPQKGRRRSSMALLHANDPFRTHDKRPTPPHKFFDNITAGKQHFVAQDKTNGIVYGWGSNAFGQLGESSALGIQCDTAVVIHTPEMSAEAAAGTTEAAAENDVAAVAEPVAAKDPTSTTPSPALHHPSAVGCASWATIFAMEDRTIRVLGKYEVAI